jgi:hypothetical protein
MIADFSCRVPHMKFGEFRNGRRNGLSQERAVASDRCQAIKFRVRLISAVERSSSAATERQRSWLSGVRSIKGLDPKPNWSRVPHVNNLKLKKVKPFLFAKPRFALKVIPTVDPRYLG